MRLTVLADNNTYIDRYFIGEPAVSYFIETEGKTILFDAGYSDAFIRNAAKLHVDLLGLDYIALSHGHNDHTWGLSPLLSLYSEAVLNGTGLPKPILVAHPETLYSKQYSSLEIGSIVNEAALERFCTLQLSKEPVWLTDKLVFLGEIPRLNAFECKKPIGRTVRQGIPEDDFLWDDTALAYQSGEGLVIITGCSHAGICNIVDYARHVCNEDRIAVIIGGLHLLNPEAGLLAATLDHLSRSNVKSLYAGHCTDLNAKIALSKVVQVNEVGVGLVLEYT